MDEELKNELKDGEKILYIGNAEPFQTLDRTNRNPFVVRTVLTVLISIALMISYTIEAMKINNFKILVPVIIAAIAYLVIASAFRDAKNIRKQKYVITDKRLIRKGDGTSGIPFSAIGQYLFKMDEDGHTSLLIGEDGIKTSSRNWRKWGASTLSVSEKGKCDQAVFYAIEQPDEFRKVFEKLVT